MLKTWLLLGGAILAEVTGTMLLRASVDDPILTVAVVVAYLIAFVLLGLTLRSGLPVGIAYGIWGAVGVALTAVLGVLLFDEALGVRAVVGIGVIVLGVLVVETGGSSSDEVAHETEVANETEAANETEVGR